MPTTIREALRAAAAYVELFTPNGTTEQPPQWAILPNGDYAAERIAREARAALASDGIDQTDTAVSQWLAHNYAQMPRFRDMNEDEREAARERYVREVWRDEYNHAAQAEGWGVFDGRDIQRDDEANVFASDDDAIEHVRRLADAGSMMHRAAFMLFTSPFV